MSPTSYELAFSAFQSMTQPVLICGKSNRIVMANYAAQSFFQTSENLLKRQTIDDHVAPSSPLLGLLAHVHERQAASSEHKIAIGNVNLPVERLVDVHVAPMGSDPNLVVITLFERTMADKIDKQLTSQGAARQVSGLAAMLAHEIKNPLSGIKGAAQLLEQSASDEDRPLARLVQQEVERIVKLVDRMEVFGDERHPELTSINIHAVLNHVLLLAENGFAKGIVIEKNFDPSLPPVLGNWDQLVQVYLNLIKNAAEAVKSEPGSKIKISTAYRPGIRVGVQGTRERLSLPLEITVEDNGPGIDADMLPHIFEPFVTSKKTGGGLGLAMVAKLIRGQGGIVDVDYVGDRTIFKTLLPMAKADTASPKKEALDE
ncbi:ATP-binding protein [uncultured Maritalea sp.]|jgi:two-component system nitrogen regulation sensor histidine kinase GlnL|uniref:two-component system sensor histidine kinase NtrB n=1 Tax=uncultured Maritalea sp. TaxID=757249 RepID=UPI002614940D|nr:ATP-binding protein [uncultured Maritalea sp.]